MSLEEKNGHTKIKNINYNEYKIQPYLENNLFTNEERNLLYALRSKCHPAKQNFKKMNRDNLLCSFGCLEIEDQNHLFNKCVRLGSTQTQPYENIFNEVVQQKQTIQTFLKIEHKRKVMKENLLQSSILSPGGVSARTRADQARDTNTLSA